MTDERIDTTDDTVTNAVLQDALGKLDLSKSGTKAELQARLADAYAAQDAGTDAAEHAGDDTDRDVTRTVDEDSEESAEAEALRSGTSQNLTPGGLLMDEGQAFVGDLSSETAKLLLEAAEDLDHDVTVVRTTSEGFIAPQDVVDKAFPNGVPDEE